MRLIAKKQQIIWKIVPCDLLTHCVRETQKHYFLLTSPAGLIFPFRTEWNWFSSRQVAAFFPRSRRFFARRLG